jgi:hypothetical protein
VLQPGTFTVTASVSIPAGCTLKGNGAVVTTSSANTFFQMNSNTRLEGITFRYNVSAANTWVQILSTASNVVITGNTFTTSGGLFPSGANIRIDGGSNHLIENNRFVAVDANDTTTSILMGSSAATNGLMIQGNTHLKAVSSGPFFVNAQGVVQVTDTLISGNFIQGPTACCAYPVQLGSMTNGLTFTGNTVQGSGVRIDNASARPVLITGNQFRNGYGAISQGTSVATRLTISSNLIDGYSNSALSLYGIDGVIITDNQISNNVEGIWFGSSGTHNNLKMGSNYFYNNTTDITDSNLSDYKAFRVAGSTCVGITSGGTAIVSGLSTISTVVDGSCTLSAASASTVWWPVDLPEGAKFHTLEGRLYGVAGQTVTCTLLRYDLNTYNNTGTTIATISDAGSGGYTGIKSTTTFSESIVNNKLYSYLLKCTSSGAGSGRIGVLAIKYHSL